MYYVKRKRRKLCVYCVITNIFTEDNFAKYEFETWF